MYHIICCGYNVEPFIERCIQSVLHQTLSSWHMSIVFDPSTDKSYHTAYKYASKKITITHNTSRMYALKNQYTCIESAGCSPDDILIFLDADDFFCTDNALEIIDGYYKKSKCLLTYGSMYSVSTGAIDKTTAYRFFEKFRTYKWKIRHPRTLAYKLFKKIPLSYLTDSSGFFYSINADLAIMIPALELAGHRRIRRISEVIYGYNDINPLNDFRVTPVFQKEIEEEIRSKPALKFCRNF